MDKLLEMSGIRKSFYGVSVLKGVDLDLDYGEVHVLLGENGAGKSTLIKILCGAYTADSGSMAVAGKTIDLSTQFIGTATGVLRAEGRIMKAGQSTIFCEGEVRSESGELVAKAIGTFRARNPKT